MNPRILFTVSRKFTTWSAARAIVERLHEQDPNAILVHGDCEHGDQQVAGMWKQLGGKDDPMPADWDVCAALDERAKTLWLERGIPPCGPGHRKVSRRHGEYCPTAGLRRDVAMIETGITLCVALLATNSQTKGAIRTAQWAEASGIPTIRYPEVPA